MLATPVAPPVRPPAPPVASLVPPVPPVTLEVPPETPPVTAGDEADVAILMPLVFPASRALAPVLAA